MLSNTVSSEDGIPVTDSRLVLPYPALRLSFLLPTGYRTLVRSIGMDPAVSQAFEIVIRSRYSVTLLAGATGSGSKTR